MKQQRLLRFLLGSLLTVVLPLGFIYGVVATNVGLQGVARLVQRVVPGVKQLQVQGRLVGPLYWRNVVYENKAVVVRLQQGRVDWRLGGLLKGDFIVENLQVDGAMVEVRNMASSKQEKAKNDYGWLGRVFIKHVQLRDVVLQPWHVRLQLQGELTDRWKLDWVAQSLSSGARGPVAAPPLGWNFLTEGNFNASGSVTGMKLAPRIKIKVDGWNLKAAEMQIGKAHLDLMADLMPNADSVLVVKFSQLRYKNYLFNSLNFQGQGKINPQLALRWQLLGGVIGEQVRGDFVARGAVSGDYKMPVVTADISVNHLQVQHYQFSSVRLTALLDQKRQSFAVALVSDSADVPPLKLVLRHVQLKAQGNTSGVMNWQGQAQSGQGVLYLKGTTALRETAFPTQFTLTGNNITVSNTNNYQIMATPDLRASYINKRLSVSGAILIPAAQIDLGGENGSAVELSKDVVFVGDDHKTTAELPIFASIQLKLGDRVHLHYEGLQTQLRGQLMINDAPDQATTGNGQINFVNGNYTYYGQTLKIRSGSQITFSGAVDNPILNIQAVKQVEAVPDTPGSAGDIVPTNTELSSMAVLPGQPLKIMVGVSVQGNVKSPQISLFSEPAILNQTDILSYLVVGQPSSQLGAGSAGALFSAISSMNSGGAGQLKETLQSLQKTVGVDFNVQSGAYVNPATNQTEQNTSVVLGKALSPKLYISYSVGILEELNALQVRYLLSKYWTLQSTSSTLGNGVDLLYMIERGK